MPFTFRILSTYPWNISQTLHQQCIKDLLSCSEGKVLVVFRVFVGKIIDWSKHEHFCTVFLNQFTHQVEFMNSPINPSMFLLPRIKNEYLDLATKLLFSFTLKWWMDVPHRRGPLYGTRILFREEIQLGCPCYLATIDYNPNISRLDTSPK